MQTRRVLSQSEHFTFHGLLLADGPAFIRCTSNGLIQTPQEQVCLSQLDTDAPFEQSRFPANGHKLNWPTGRIQPLIRESGAALPRTSEAGPLRVGLPLANPD